MNFFSKISRFLETLPDWVSIPLLIIEILVLLLLVFWLYITRAVSTVEVPEVMGRQLQEAEEILARSGLSMRVEWESSMQTPEGEIMNQVPGPGTEIKENRPLTVYASRGPEYLEVPDLEGQSVSEAQNFLQRLSAERETVGLGLGNITRVHSEELPADHIIRQFPPPELEVVAGSQVNVLVSRGNWPRRLPVPDFRGLSEEEARNKLEAVELQVGQVRHIREEEMSPGVVLDQSPPPNVLVPTRQPVLLTVNLGEEERFEATRYTTLKINPPLEVVPGRLKVELTDRSGRRVIFEEEVPPGEKVEVFTGVTGSGRVAIYWNGELIRYRELEVAG